MDAPPGRENDKRWLESPGNLTRLYLALWIVCAGLVLADLVYHKHVHFRSEEWFGFYGFFGFLAYSFIVVAGFLWRRLVKRREDYYDE